MRKLTAAGADIDVTALDIALPRLAADEPAFDVFLEALTERSAVEFDYWRTGTDAPAGATCSPGASPATPGAGTSLGFDTDRGAERVFRLSRVQGEAVKVGKPAAYEIPRRPRHRRLDPAPGSGAEPAAGGGARPQRQRAAAAADGRERRDRRRRTRHDHRLGPARRSRGAPSASRTRCSATAPASTSRSRAGLRQAVVARLTAWSPEPTR